MSESGYSAARQKSDEIAAALHDFATLIGEPKTEPVTLQTGGEIVPGLGLTGDAADVNRRAHDVEQGIFKVLVLGEFKNGKSTLLNAILGSKTLPAKATPATAIITVLVRGDSEQVAIYETGKEDEPRRMSWADFNEEFKLTTQDIEALDKSGFLDRFAEIDYAQLETKHPFCANGVRLIDSPGLGEQASRTRVTTNFLKQAQAVIFVLNATRILSDDEKKFIEGKLGGGRLNNVFFVVNRINQIEPEGYQEVRDWVTASLKHHFLDEQGQFDQDFFDRRVFFINAHGALAARSTEVVDEALLKASKVPELEAELEKFLTSDEKVAATFESTVQFLETTLTEAQRRIEQQKTTLDQPLAELEKRQTEAEGKLQHLEQRKQDIERTVLLFRDVIKRNIYSNLRDYIYTMHNSWPQDSQSIINLDEAISLVDVLQSFISKDTEAKIAGALEGEVKKYLKVKLGAWSENLPAIVQGDIAKMMTEIEGQIQDFQLELDQISSLFAGEEVQHFVDADQLRAGRLLQLILGFNNFGEMGSATLGKEDWSNFFARMLQQVITVYLVFGLFSGPIAWIILLTVELVYLFLHRERLKERLVEKLGDRLHEELLKELPNRQAEIYALVEKRFAQFTRHINNTLQGQIDEKRAEIVRIVRQKQDQTFSVEREKQRLDAIGAKLTELYDKASTAAGYTPSKPSGELVGAS